MCVKKKIAIIGNDLLCKSTLEKQLTLLKGAIDQKTPLSEELVIKRDSLQLKHNY